MIWLIFVLVAVALLMVLEVLPAHLSALTVDMTNDNYFYVMSTLLVGCAFLCLKFNQFSPKTVITKLSLWVVNALLLAVMMVLFVMRTIGVEQDFARVANLIPEQGYTITADVSIYHISDGVYHEEGYYRQQAILSNLAFYDGNHKQTGDTVNPFAVRDDIPSTRQPLPEQLSVLLQAGQANKKNKDNLTELSQLRPNTTTKMTLFITPMATNPSVSGFDSARWLRTRHIHAHARVLAIDGEILPMNEVGLVGKLEQFRQVLREHFYQNWQNMSDDRRQAQAVTLSLLTGDRALINRSTKDLYQFGGISHLLAISGTHVVFLAMMLAFMVCRISDKFVGIYHIVPRHHLRLIVMMGASLVYALFTGFEVPAVRTVYMMLAVALVGWLAIPVSSMTILMVIALIMMWFDPVVVWQAGFWLSFVAVALLMSYGEREFDTAKGELKDRAVGLLKLQTYLFIAMLPISLLLFGKVSLWGLVVNLFAVGLFGAVIVPINLLAGVVFVVLPSVADILWGISSLILLGLNDGLQALQNMGGVWLYRSMSVAGVLLFAIAIVVWINPLISRKFALVPALACVAMSFHGQMPHSPFRVMVLESDDDNLSQVLIRQHHADDSVSGEAVWLVLSDFNEGLNADKFAQNLLDRLHQENINHLTGVIVQTPNTNIAQALPRIHQEIPIYRYWQAGKHHAGSLPSLPCEVGRSWQGKGLTVLALTGWQMIDDEAVWGCTIVIDSHEYALLVGGIRHDFHQSNNTTHRLIINGASHAHTWTLYEYLCRDDEVSTDVWLTHSRHVMPDDIAKFSPKSLIHTNKNTATNQEKVAVTVAGFTN